MEEYKICPECNGKNKKTAEICRWCMLPLNDIMPTTDEIEEAKKKAEPEIRKPDPTPSPSPKEGKVCEECGYENPMNLRKCEKCGAPLPSAVQSAMSARQAFTPMLSSEDGSFRFLIPLGETVIGRERTMREYLLNRMYVGRAHGKLTNLNGRVFYEDVDAKNGTLINMVKVAPGQKVELKNGDRLALGHNPKLAVNDRSLIAYLIFGV